MNRIGLRAIWDAGWVWGSVEAMRLSDWRCGLGFGLLIDFPVFPLNVTFGNASRSDDLWTVSLGFSYRWPR